MIEECRVWIDESGRELRDHGNRTFPCACYQNYLGQGDVPWHWHEEIELLYIKKGRLHCAAGGRRFRLREGDALFVNSGIPHSYEKDMQTDYEENDIVFHPRLIYGEIGSIYYGSYMVKLLQNPALAVMAFCRDVPWQERVIELLREAVRECGLESRYYEFKVRQKLTEICILILENCGTKFVPEDYRKQSVSLERAKVMLDYFHGHYQETVTVGDLAAEANVCKRECQRVFKSVLGMTPTAYFEQYRLNLAEKLLGECGDSVMEIAGRCGFQSPSYFTKLFRKRYGITPTEYRQQKAKGET